ncbi:MAG: DUF4339 domain-containing protein [Alphaproteobacteria bacterium]|nr:DUF4339 domain-containing protein [Alphaproteobacteria bacterium]
MSRWLVNQGSSQFSVQDLAELKELAQQGRLGAGDMVQPPGASDWLYAAELPELQGLLKTGGGSSFDEDDLRPKRNLTPVLIAVLVVLLGIGGYAFVHFAQKVPEARNLDALGDLELSEMLVTADPARMKSEPGAGTDVGSAAKDSKVQLLAKRGGFYEIESEGKKGWVAVDEVVPAYFFESKEKRDDYDPVYNPDRYVFVKNASWMQLPDQRRDNITIFQLMLSNKSKFVMADVVLSATIKDKNGNVLETKDVPLKGTVAAFGDTMVGTLAPPEGDRESEPELMTRETFEAMAEKDEDLALRWSDGIEVQLDSEGFVEANIDLVQVRAIPKKDE